MEHRQQGVLQHLDNDDDDDDSMKIGGKRTRGQHDRLRKRPEQMEVLRKAYKENHGKMPSRAQRNKLAEQLGLRQKQVYKWFWEIKKQRDSEGSDIESRSTVNELETMTDL